MNTAAPKISGSPHPGGTLTATNGSWTGTPPIAFAKQWQSQSPSGAWTDIPSATHDTYVLTDADANKSYRVVVSAGNAICSWSMALSDTLAGHPRQHAGSRHHRQAHHRQNAADEHRYVDGLANQLRLPVGTHEQQW
ncbi:MAG: hypothetical protein LC790_17630, partial [Actinobacteria bacterium]|nr:hypothetical protein [Actinomycetota bacterium]